MNEEGKEFRYLSGRLPIELHKKLKLQLVKDDLSYQEWMESKVREYVEEEGGE